ncbi:hypothetical protein DFS34DRAFT_420009 [Phlyctochytrium arcticum]|nr:hypothetical protein DFS34DRAFT_420009 [Phlyctochytrium arcticum]
MPNVPQRPAQKPASQSSVPAPDTPQSRAPPVVRPKPKALSTEGPSETVAPLAAEKSPIARSQVSLADVGGQMSDIGSDEHDQEPPKPNVRPELNRMLSGPPPRAVRSVPRPMSQVDMDRVHAEAGDVSNPASPVRSSPSRRGTIATYSQPLDDSEYDYVEDAPSASEVTSHAQEEPIVQPAVPPRPSQPTTTGDPVDAEIVQGSDEHGKSVKEKQKAMKSPKMGIRGMLSHLTKSRPKKGKKGAKEDDEDLEEADTHGPGPVMADPNAAPEEHFDDQPVEQISSVPPASDPVESADYDHVPSHLKEKSLASGRSSRHTHSRPGSNGSAAPFNVSQTTGVQNDAAGNTQHQNASVEDLRDDRDPNRPPSVPTRPKRPQNAAMSALASVMRGGNARPDESIDSDDAASVSSAKGSLASGAAVRTSIYSDSGDSEHFNERPLSQYSSHTQPGGAPSGRPQSQYSTGPGVGPRPASQYSTGQAHGGRPPSQYSMGQVSEAGTDRRSIHHDAREEVEPRGRGQVISPARKSMHEDSVSVSSSAPDDLPAVAPRRPPKPVQSNSPMRRSAADPGSPAGPPVIPQKPAVSRKSMHIEDGGPASPTSRKSLYMMDDVTPRSPTGSVPPPQHRPRPPPAAQDRPKSTFSSNSTGSAMHDSGSGHQEYTQETEEPVPAEVAASPRPRRIPGVFATNHGALGALAAAVTGRGAQAHTYDEPERESDGHQYDAPPSDVVVPGHHADQSNLRF